MSDSVDILKECLRDVRDEYKKMLDFMFIASPHLRPVSSMAEMALRLGQFQERMQQMILEAQDKVEKLEEEQEV